MHDCLQVGKLSGYVTSHLGYEGRSISNEKNMEAKLCDPNHFTVFQYNLLKGQHIFLIDEWAILHRPWKIFCPAVQTSRLPHRQPLHHCKSYVHEQNLSKIATHGSLLEPDLANTAGDLTDGSRTLELQPRQQQTCGQARCRDKEARDATFPGIFVR